MYSSRLFPISTMAAFNQTDNLTKPVSAIIENDQHSQMDLFIIIETQIEYIHKLILCELWYTIRYEYKKIYDREVL